MPAFNITDGEKTIPFGALQVSYGNKSVVFSNGLNRKKSLNIPNGMTVNDLFGPIVAYVNQLPDESKESIFKHYEAISEVFEEHVDMTLIDLQVKKLVGKIYNLIDFEDLCKWCDKNITVPIPSLVANSFKDTDISMRSGSGEYMVTTYLKDDYMELYYLGIYLKLMIPVWSRYMILIDAVLNSKSIFKERIVLDLMSNTDVFDLKPTIRLLGYITATATKKIQFGSIVGGIGTEEIPHWLICKVLIRKIAFVAKVEGKDVDKSSIVSIIFQFIDSELNSSARRLIGDVRDKKMPKNGQDTNEGDGDSFLETYRQRQMYSDDSLTMYLEFIKQKSVMEHIDVLWSVYDMQKFSEMQERNGVSAELNVKSINLELLNSRIEAHERALAKMKDRHKEHCSTSSFVKWFISPANYMGSEIHDYLDIQSLDKIIVVSAVFIELLGYNTIAGVITGRAAVESDGAFIGGTSVKQQIDKRLIQDRVNVEFPYEKPQRSKENLRQRNYLLKEITELADEITVCDWLNDAAGGIIVVPGDIKNILIHLALDLNELTYTV